MLLLLYDPDGVLRGSRYRGEPQRRTAERDAAVERAPLLSLTNTSSPHPARLRRIHVDTAALAFWRRRMHGAVSEAVEEARTVP
jgi:hypothetical protein